MCLGIPATNVYIPAVLAYLSGLISKPPWLAFSYGSTRIMRYPTPIWVWMYWGEPGSFSNFFRRVAIKTRSEATSTLVGFLFYQLGFTEANIITLYILGVMLVSISTKSSVCSFIASIVGVLTFNFFFTEPRFSLHAYDSGYPVTFLVMFLASLLTGSLASKLKTHAKRSAQVAWRTKWPSALLCE